MAEYRITTGQSLFDVAIQKYGSLESVVKLITDNLDTIGNINNSNLGGAVIQVSDFNNTLTDSLRLNNRYLNTSDPKIIEGIPFDYGFDFGFES